VCGSHIIRQLISDTVNDAIERYEKIYPWMDDDGVPSYFEINADSDVREAMNGIQCIASKTYARGLIFITVYFEGVFYVSIADGTGDQPLLDVRFPDVSKPGEGVTLVSYVDNDVSARWQKLTLWQSMAGEVKLASLLAPRAKKTKDLTSDCYVQSYVVMKPTQEDGGGQGGGANRYAIRTAAAVRTSRKRDTRHTRTCHTHTMC